MAKKYVETRSAIVTGAGTGLGFATAKMLKEQGWKVYGTIIEGQSDTELKKLGIEAITVKILPTISKQTPLAITLPKI